MYDVRLLLVDVSLHQIDIWTRNFKMRYNSGFHSVGITAVILLKNPYKQASLSHVTAVKIESTKQLEIATFLLSKHILLVLIAELLATLQAVKGADVVYIDIWAS